MKELHDIDGVTNCEKSPHKTKERAVNENPIKEQHANFETEVKNLNQEETPFICGQCGKAFSNLESCTKHVNIHLFKCYKCAFETSNKIQLKAHERNEQEFYKCKSDHEDSCDTLNSENIQQNGRQTFEREKCGRCFEWNRIRP